MQSCLRNIVFFLLLISAVRATGQNSFKAVIKDKDTDEPLVGATAVIEGTTIGGIADPEGKIAIADIANGRFTLVVSFVGYDTEEVQLEFPYRAVQPLVIHLESGQELEVIYVSATRSSRMIEEIPTRTEVITGEELGEKAAMNSTNIAMILRESTGILVQQTSANSANQSLRIQGLDGRYTQLLRDGFPLYSGFSGGLSIMQVPPLDLQQVEVIKGSSSTLYGGGAIAGLVNLVTKQPRKDDPELDIMYNQTSALGSTANIFWSQRSDKLGFTIYGSGNTQAPYDPNDDNFSDIPKMRGAGINSKIFWYPSNRTTAWLGINTSFEDRQGGDLNVLEGKPDSSHQFSEQNLSGRFSYQFHLEHTFKSGAQIVLRNSISTFDRSIEIPGYVFRGHQVAGFSEIDWTKTTARSDWIVGANLFTDDFKEDTVKSAISPRDYAYLTSGIFVQNTWSLNKKLTLESGFRTDYNKYFGFFPLPRISLLIKPSSKLNARIGGGLGYKLPTIFNEQAEILTFQEILPIDPDGIKPENSIGANFDINYQTLLTGSLTLSINQLFYYTKLRKSLVLESDMSGGFSFTNADGPVQSKGFETNVKFGLEDFNLFFQYSFNDVQLDYLDVNRQKPLTPKHNAGAVLMFEQEHKWRVGYELYYIGEQFRSDYSRTRDYWIMGLMAMREFERISCFINFENFTDTRQSRFQSMVIPPNTDPSFTEIWAPTDGFVANAGFIIRIL